MTEKGAIMGYELTDDELDSIQPMPAEPGARRRARPRPNPLDASK